jgi:hypothetical protein
LGICPNAVHDSSIAATAAKILFMKILLWMVYTPLLNAACGEQTVRQPVYSAS